MGDNFLLKPPQVVWFLNSEMTISVSNMGKCGLEGLILKCVFMPLTAKSLISVFSRVPAHMAHMLFQSNEPKNELSSCNR